jgi:hypothetical protein
MKRIPVLIASVVFIVLQAMPASAFDNSSDQRKFLLKLVKGFQGSRDSIIVTESPVKELVNMDLQIINTFKMHDLTPAQKEVSDFIKEIIVYNISVDTAPCIAGFDLLEYNFEDKKYFVDSAVYCVYMFVEDNPYVIERIYQGYSRMLAEHHETILDRVRVVLKGTETIYIRNRRQYGRGPVISSLALFFNTYMELVTDGKIVEDLEENKEDYERRKAILGICELLDLDRSKGIYDVYPHVKDLKYSYVFYSNT